VTRRQTHGFHAAVKNGPAAPELLPPMRMTASWLRPLRVRRIQVRGARSARTMRAPLGIVNGGDPLQKLARHNHALVTERERHCAGGVFWLFGVSGRT
jgi:hypothetical protein